MPDIEEIGRSLRGAWLVCLGNSQGLGLFERSLDAFWRSFFAMVVAAPLYVLHLGAERSLKAAAPAEQELVSGGAYYLISGVSYVVDWIAFPVLMIFIARLLDLNRAYSLYITVFNWSSVILIAVISPPFILHGFGLISTGIANLLAFAALIFALRARYMVAQLALEVSRGLAMALVAAEFAVSLTIAQLTMRLTG